MSELFAVCLGLVALLIGAEGVVRGGRGLAARVGVSELAVGLVVASVGTSLPELFTTSMAARSAAAGDPQAGAIGIGNVVGSNLFLLLVLLGLVGIFRNLPVDRRVWRRDGLAVGASTVALVVFGLDGRIGGLEGAILLIGFFFWLSRVWQEETGRSEADGEARTPPEGPGWTDGVRVLAGLGLLGVGSDMVVEHGVALATALHVNTTLIGVLAGVGTSLPEVGVSLRAGEEGAELSLGNLLGSALTNALLCAGTAAVVGHMEVPVDARSLELPFLVTATVVALALTWEREDLTRAEGIALIALFGLYITLRIIG